MPEKSDRLQYIDIAKFFGIVMVVAGHILPSNDGLKYFFYTIHVPMFLLLSGVFEKKRDHVPSYLLKVFRRLYLPCILIITTDYFFYTLIYKTDILRHTIPRILNNLVAHAFTFDTPIWFLIDLFFVKVLFLPIHLIRNGKAQKIVLGMISGVGIVYMYAVRFIKFDNNYYGIYALAVVLTYYCLGCLIKDLIVMPAKAFAAGDKKKIRIFMILMAVFLTYTAVSSWFNGNVGVLGLNFGNVALFLTGSLLGAYGFIILSVLLSSLSKNITKPMVYLGRHTLFIMATHYYLVEHLAKYILGRLGKKDIYHNPLVEIVIFLLTMGICTLCLLIIDFAKKKVFKPAP